VHRDAPYAYAFIFDDAIPLLFPVVVVVLGNVGYFTSRQPQFFQFKLCQVSKDHSSKAGILIY
jgi:hypothetical protein